MFFISIYLRLSHEQRFSKKKIQDIGPAASAISSRRSIFTAVQFPIIDKSQPTTNR